VFSSLGFWCLFVVLIYFPGALLFLSTLGPAFSFYAWFIPGWVISFFMADLLYPPLLLFLRFLAWWCCVWPLACFCDGFPHSRSCSYITRACVYSCKIIYREKRICTIMAAQMHSTASVWSRLLRVSNLKLVINGVGKRNERKVTQRQGEKGQCVSMCVIRRRAGKERQGVELI